MNLNTVQLKTSVSSSPVFQDDAVKNTEEVTSQSEIKVTLLHENYEMDSH